MFYFPYFIYIDKCILYNVKFAFRYLFPPSFLVVVWMETLKLLQVYLNLFDVVISYVVHRSWYDNCMTLLLYAVLQSSTVLQQHHSIMLFTLLQHYKMFCNFLLTTHSKVFKKLKKMAATNISVYRIPTYNIYSFNCFRPLFFQLLP